MRNVVYDAVDKHGDQGDVPDHTATGINVTRSPLRSGPHSNDALGSLSRPSRQDEADLRAEHWKRERCQTKCLIVLAAAALVTFPAACGSPASAGPALRSAGTLFTATRRSWTWAPGKPGRQAEARSRAGSSPRRFVRSAWLLEQVVLSGMARHSTRRAADRTTVETGWWFV